MAGLLDEGSVGRFEKHEIVGKGAYGAVFRGVHKQTGQVVALKVIDLEHPDNEDIGEIQKEVAVLSQLRDAGNNNVIVYYGCWVERHELWIAMDYASGGSIRTLMKAGPIEEQLIVIIAREVLIALAYLDKEGVIHRDIKAANILLTQTGRILLCDFGVAAHLTTSSKRSTFIGTPYWMAPEVILENKSYDTKADVWSFGVTVYEIAYGNPPYAKMEPLRAIATIPHNPPAKLEGAQWSQPMKDFVALAMTPDPAVRPSAEELSRTKWIKSAAKMPTALLRELIVRYGGWVNAGGVRTSIIGDVARRDDTFDFDIERPSSWVFDDTDDVFGSQLGDEPYYGQNRNRLNLNLPDTAAKPTPNHPLMNLFNNDEAATPTNAYFNDSGYGGSIQIPVMDNNSNGWGTSDTLRPKSINIPDFDNDTGVSAFAPQSTPWWQESATRVGLVQPDIEIYDDQEPAPVSGPFDAGPSTIGIPSDLSNAPTVRPSWARDAGKAAGSFSLFSSDVSKPNPFPKTRGRGSNDSTHGSDPFSQSNGPSFSGGGLEQIPASPPDDFVTLRRAASPESLVGNKANMSASPSLPSLARKATQEDDLDTSRTAVSPSVAHRLRSNTAPVFDSSLAPTIPEAPAGKAVLNFSKPSPFAGGRPAMQRKPTALNVSEANAHVGPGAATPRHATQSFDDSLPTPMASASPVSSARLPVNDIYSHEHPVSPFPPPLSASTFAKTPLSAVTTVPSLADWPRGPPIRPFDYAAFTKAADVSGELDRVISELGQWLSAIDAGMSQILADSSS